VERVAATSARYRLPIDPTATVSTLPVSAQQRVEILKALAHDARLLILDEPTAVLTADESHELLHQLRDFVQRDGGTVILITHKLRDALQFADDVTVLRKGKTVASGPATTFTESSLATAMLGTPWDTSKNSQMLGAVSEQDSLATHGSHDVTAMMAPAVIQLSDVSVRDSRGVTRLDRISLTLHAGEILGVAAVEGHGQHELLRILAGRLAPTSGTVTRPAHVGFVPEDRHRDGLILDFSLTENVQLAGAGQRHGIIEWHESQKQTAHVLDRYHVSPSNTNTPARTLSGGNQQKLVLGRELESVQQALVVENPTRGLGIQATLDIHRRLHDARDQGLGVVVYSSDLDEVLTVADRILVLYGGSLLPVLHDREQVGRAMLGTATTP
jgi:simple sugar transport system ATP-binding protein